MMMRGSRYIEENTLIIAIGTSIYLIGSVVSITVALYRIRNRLGKKEIQDQYSTFYVGI